MKLRLMHPAVGEIAFPLKPGGSLVIGRLGSMTDVEISWDPRISRRHCRLWEKDGRVWFQDLASRNGSWIGNDKVAGVVRLAPGASILIGETILLLPEHREKSPEVEETIERPATAEEMALLEEALEGPFLEREPPTAPLRPPTETLTARSPLPRAGTLPTRGRESVSTEPPERHEHHEIDPVDSDSRKPSATIINTPTVDLRSPSEPLPLAPEAPAPPAGQVQFLDPGTVEVRARSREELRELWLRDISKGGLFVETRSPPLAGTRVQVRLETPGGGITLRGTVVHVLTEEMAHSFGGRAGVGIQFIDLDPGTRDAIQAYIEGASDRLQGGSSDLDTMPDDEGEEIIETARKFLQDAERADFYIALDVRPTASADHIERAAARLQQQLSEATQRMAPPRAARLEAALGLLGRVRRILTHEEGRLEYDFRNGHVRAQERISSAAAGVGPSLSTLRNAWNRVFPDRVDQAALLTRKAFAARQRQDIAAAIEAGRAALELNPFFEELKQTVQVWESTIERQP